MAKIFHLSLAIIYLTIIFIANSAMAQSAVEVPSSQKMGQMLYEKFCAECHGKDLNGTDKGPPFLHRVYLPGHHGDTSFYKAAMDGAKAHHWKFGDMKPVEGIEEAHVTLIVKFVRYVQKKAGMY